MDGSLRALPGILDTREIPPVPGVAICMMGAWTASPPAAITQGGSRLAVWLGQAASASPAEPKSVF